MIELDLVQVLMCLLAFFLVIELGLTWGLVHLLQGQTKIANFVLFCTVWSFILLIYLFFTSKYIPKLFRRRLALSLLFITVVFWLCGSITLGTWVGIPHPTNHKQRVAQAASAFGFFIWTIFTILMWMEWKAMRQTNKIKRENYKDSSLGTGISSSTYMQTSSRYAESSVV